MINDGTDGRPTVDERRVQSRLIYVQVFCRVNRLYARIYKVPAICNAVCSDAKQLTTAVVAFPRVVVDRPYGNNIAYRTTVVITFPSSR